MYFNMEEEAAVDKQEYLGGSFTQLPQNSSMILRSTMGADEMILETDGSGLDRHSFGGLLAKKQLKK